MSHPKLERLKELFDIAINHKPCSKDFCEKCETFEELNEEFPALKTIPALIEVIEKQREALRSYAGKGKYSAWADGCRYLTFDKFGGLCEETAGPWEAKTAIEETEKLLEGI